MSKAPVIPRCRLANRAEAAAHFRVALTTIDAWLRAGAPVVRRGSRGVAWALDLDALERWAAASQQSEVRQARKALDHWQAQLAEQKYRDRAGTLLERAGAERAAAQVLAIVAEALAKVPAALQAAAGLTPAQAEECERIIDSLSAGLGDKLRQLGGW